MPQLRYSVPPVWPHHLSVGGGGSPEHLSAPRDKMKPMAKKESPLHAAADKIIETLSAMLANPAAVEAQAFESIMNAVVDDFVGQVAAVGTVVGPAGAWALQQQTQQLLVQLDAYFSREIAKVETNPALRRVLLAAKKKVFARRAAPRPEATPSPGAHPPALRAHPNPHL